MRGHTPQLSVATWMGPEQPVSMAHPACDGPVTGGCLPTSMWRAFMRSAVRALDLPAEDFPAAAQLPTRVVPDLVAKDVDRARTELERAGFAVEVAEVDDWRREGTVVGADPEHGTGLPRGSIVTLRVSDGEGAVPTVPDLVGVDAAEAERRLRGAGLRVRTATSVVEDAAERGMVVAQAPAAGEPAVSRLVRRPVTVRLVVGVAEA